MGTASLLDIAPTILAIVGIAAPSYMDGLPLQGLESPPLLSSQAPAALGREAQLGVTHVFNEGEYDEVTQRLRNLGYL